MNNLKEDLGYGCVGIIVILLIVFAIKLIFACITGLLVYWFWNYALVSWFPTVFTVQYWQCVLTLFILYVIFWRMKIKIKD